MANLLTGARLAAVLASFSLITAALPSRAADDMKDGKTPSSRKPAAAAAAPAKPVVIDLKAIALLKPAIDALTKEAIAGMKDGKNTGLREKSDYFSGETKLPDGVTPDVLLAALEKPVNRQPAVDAYVKWQLLSGLPASLNDQQIVRLYTAYKAAPDPQPNPGLNRDKLQAALYKVGAMNTKNDVLINGEFEKAMDEWNANNTYIVDYRDALHAKLPANTYDSVFAGLSDLFSRVKNGLEVKPFWEKVETSVRTWSAFGTPPQVNTIVSGLTKLDETVKDPKYKPYTRVVQSTDPKKMGLVWDDRTVINTNYLESLISDLKDALRPTPGATSTAKMK